MSSFIKLSSSIINKLHIVEIYKTDSAYRIYMSNVNISGFWCAVFGSISTEYNRIDVCETKNKKDYDIITKFIENID